MTSSNTHSLAGLAWAYDPKGHLPCLNSYRGESTGIISYDACLCTPAQLEGSVSSLEHQMMTDFHHAPTSNCMLPFKRASQLPDMRKRLRGTAALVAITEAVMPLMRCSKHGREIRRHFDGGVGQGEMCVVHGHQGSMKDVCRQHADEESVENCRSSMFFPQ